MKISATNLEIGISVTIAAVIARKGRLPCRPSCCWTLSAACRTTPSPSRWTAAARA
jgi:hypothetical protein